MSDVSSVQKLPDKMKPEEGEGSSPTAPQDVFQSKTSLEGEITKWLLPATDKAHRASILLTLHSNELQKCPFGSFCGIASPNQGASPIRMFTQVAAKTGERMARIKPC